MKLFVTVFDPAAIARIDADHDGVELRAENLPDLDVSALRTATKRPIILTYRGRVADPGILSRALDAGIDFVDVEYQPGMSIAHDRSRVVLSHHDYEGTPDLDVLLEGMLELGCAHTKIAVTPQNFDDNRRLLRKIAPGVSVIGMGERGLYSRILAPFAGSELAFVAGSEVAAPGQLPLRRALDIYGPDRQSLRAKRFFSLVGNPAGQSLSPTIHNPLFREKGVPAAYTVATVESFDEVTGAFRNGELSGLSVTSPFKDAAFDFAQDAGAKIGENAREAEAVNTLVRARKLVADNTDVDGFAAILGRICGRDRKSAAVLGGGGTARAAVVALKRQSMDVTIFNRTASKAREIARRFGARAEPFEALRFFDGEIVINALPGSAPVDLPLRPGMSYVEAAYGGPKKSFPGIEYVDGVELLHAQAVRQHELFMQVFE